MPGIRIKGNGKGGAGGSSGQGGSNETEFQRLWNEVLRHPNPSTIRTFKELFENADPSQTLFGTKGSGTGVDIGKATSQANRALHQHLSRLERMARSNADMRSVSQHASNIAALAEVLSSAGIKIDTAVRNRMSAVADTVSSYQERMRNIQIAEDKRREEIQARKEQARKEREKRQAQAQAQKEWESSPAGIASKVRNGLITSSIRGAETALAYGDLPTFRVSYASLKKLEQNSAKQVALLQKGDQTDQKILQAEEKRHRSLVEAVRAYGERGIAQWGSRATQPLSRGQQLAHGIARKLGVGGLIEDGIVGDLIAGVADPIAIAGAVTGLAAYGAYKMVKKPFKVIGSAQKLYSAQISYINARRLASRIAGQGGMMLQGGPLYQSFFGKNGEASPWLANLGLTGQQGLALLNSYGVPALSVNAAKYNVSQIARLQKFYPYLRNFSEAQIGSWGALGSIVGYTGKNNRVDPQVLNAYAQAIAKGVKEGIGGSETVKILNHAIVSLANANALTGNFRSTQRYISGMMQLPFSSMRTGAGEASVFGLLNHAFNNIQNYPALLTGEMMYFQKYGMNKASLERLGGKTWYEENKKQLQNAQTIYNSGMKLLAFSTMNPIMTELSKRAVTRFTASTILGESVPNERLRHALNDLATGSLVGGNVVAGAGINAPLSSRQVSGFTPSGVTQYGAVSGKYASLINAAAKKYGVPARLLYNIMMHESGGKKFADNGSHYGLFQMSKNMYTSLHVNPFSARQTIPAAAKKLAEYRKELGSWFLAGNAWYLGRQGSLEHAYDPNYVPPGKGNPSVGAYDKAIFAGVLSPYTDGSPSGVSPHVRNLRKEMVAVANAEVKAAQTLNKVLGVTTTKVANLGAAGVNDEKFLTAFTNFGNKFIAQVTTALQHPEKTAHEVAINAANVIINPESPAMTLGKWEFSENKKTFGSNLGIGG